MLFMTSRNTAYFSYEPSLYGFLALTGCMTRIFKNIINCKSIRTSQHEASRARELVGVSPAADGARARAEPPPQRAGDAPPHVLPASVHDSELRHAPSGNSINAHYLLTVYGTIICLLMHKRN